MSIQKQYKSLCFYNWYGNGDLFTSRQFVKNVMEIVPAENYYYAHGKSFRMFADIENLQYAKVQDFMRNDAAWVEGQDNDLYLNTWIGRDSKYVLPGVGCTLANYYRMYNDMLEEKGFGMLNKAANFYIPRVGYHKFELSTVDNFIRENIGKRKILISNGDVQSNQADNFAFEPIFARLCNEYAGKEILFIATTPTGFSHPNLVYTKDIIKTVDGFDLNEISYLSLFTDTIVGRSSGPYVFSQAYENYMDITKAMLSFCYHPNALDFVGPSVPVKIMRIWGNVKEEKHVFETIKAVINR
jgi:hypothetical protein